MDWYHTKGGADRVRKLNRQKRYGVTHEWFTEQMQKQGGLCANQRCPNPATAIDHNHDTGKVRSILCNGCNTALGLIKESPSRAEGLIDYIRSHA
jgi:Pyruvate/2-oxoacid:ferredoxin oxidoreductase delta subunit